jgi:hypothetical protein
MKWRGIYYYANYIAFGEDDAHNWYENLYGKQKEWGKKECEKK